MKRLLLVLLIPLVIGCTNKEKSNGNETSSVVQYKSKGITNVLYYWDYDTHSYLVYTKDKTYKCPPKNYYEIKVNEYKRVIETIDGQEHYGDFIYNEYFVSNNELFVYYR